MPETKESKEITRTLIEGLLTSQCPEVDLSSLTHIATGWSHDVWRCDETLFRFPLHENSVSLNVPLLAHLNDILSVRLPECIFQGRPTSEYKGTFIGYRWIQGESLIRVTLSERETDKLVAPLASFLRTLHQFGASTAKRFSLPTTDKEDELSMRTEVAKLRTRELSTGMYAELSATALEAMKVVPDKCVDDEYRLVHGDLHAGQILLDAQCELVAVIDWDDLRLGDPAYDLQMVYSLVPSSSRAQFWNLYGPFEGRGRARHLALSYGLAFLARATRVGDSVLARSAALQLRNALCH